MLNIICNIGEDAPIRTVQGWNRVIAWFLRQEMRKLGYPCRLVDDKIGTVVPKADHTLLVSGVSFARMFNPKRDARGDLNYQEMITRATRKKITVYLDWDLRQGFPYDAIFTATPPKRGKPYVYAGWGADPKYCYPEQCDVRTIFFDDAHEPIDNPAHRQAYVILQKVLEDLENKGTVVIRERTLHRTDPPRKKSAGWEAWDFVMSLRRRCHFHCDMGLREGGLERVEAARCGSLIVVPVREPPLRVLQPLVHKTWGSERELQQILASQTDPMMIAKQAKKQAWWRVARRIIDELERK